MGHSSPQTRLVLLGAASAFLGLGGCSAEPAAPPSSLDASVGDAGDAVDAGTVTPPDAANLPDSGAARDAAVAGLQCEPCTEDADCGGDSYCVALPSGGQVCLRACVPDLPQCPARFDCIDSLLTDLPDPVCTPVGERCCVDADADDHGTGVGCRGLDCNEDDPNVHADAPEVCNGVDDDCDGMVDEGNPGGGLVCSTGMTGACSSGVTVCEEGSSVCRPDAATTTETCDGVDQDCDGSVDEDEMGRALTRPCYDGPAGTEGRGGCTAGVQTCAGGEYRSCVGQVLPSIEDCDGVDDDCDGMIDDGNPGGGFACTTASPGVCAAGNTECRAGAVQCVGTVAPGSRVEICDDLDNDCDGLRNEGFPGLGTACFSGMGVCRRAGVTVCNPGSPTSPPICDAAPGTPSPVEQCDYVDDDCDGLTDEGFASGGVYNTVAHCGACGFDCRAGWPGGASTYHVVPRCNVAGGSASCAFDCAPGWVDADGVRDNGCELLPESDTVYVSTPANGGMDVAGCGAWNAPCESVGGGIVQATVVGAVRVRVSSGLYRENVELSNGISVLGGHNHVNWVRNLAVYGTTIRGVDTGPVGGAVDDRVVVMAVGITAPTELSGFSITGVNAGGSGNSIGVYVRNSDDDLLLRDNDIAPGAGGNGETGAVGTPGLTGVVGASGSGPARRTCGSAATAGPAGGARTCGGTSVSGGAGGSGTNPVTSAASPTRSGSGVRGAPTGGVGGPGGFHLEGTSSPGGGRSCIVYENPIEGTPGTDGAAGADGSGGAGAVGAAGAVVGTRWQGSAGAAGGAGAAGRGGGGGGSPGGVDADGSSYCLFPATGGGGGSGGCGGVAGGGGRAGGASFAIFVVHTTAPTAATMPRINGNRLRRGLGGRGGDGGTGGGGGEGGSSGAGGPNTSASTSGDPYAFCLFAGAPGGAGGRGGHAGGGGGGGGGASYDVWVSRPGTAAPSYGGNTFDIPPAVDTAGAGGAGGNSSNTAVGIGGTGVRGASGTLRIGT